MRFSRLTCEIPFGVNESKKNPQQNIAFYFAKVKKGLKNDGELVVIDFFKTDVPVGPPTNHKVSIDEVVAELKKARYTSFEVNVDLLPYQFIVKAK